MRKKWTGEKVAEISRGFQPACVLMAGAELGVFDALADTRRSAQHIARGMTAEALARRLKADARAMRMLADALTSLGLLTLRGGRYSPGAGVADLLTETGRRGGLAMVRHQANCLRSWAQLAWVVKTGRPAKDAPSVRGAAADQAAFIEAMDDASRTLAPELAKRIGPPPFRHLLDIGGGPGTWTIAFLRAAPSARATLLDLPHTMPIARRHIAAAGLQGRVRLVAGDLDSGRALPRGADLAWISAIVHMNSRAANRDLFRKTRAALVDGGRVLIRDVVMRESRTAPEFGALFAINMLVNTPKGGTFTFRELSEDLLAAGFQKPSFLHRGEAMDSVIQALK
jgi:predicted O-methyltransferase YrrM